jgi:hypothetical protein
MTANNELEDAIEEATQPVDACHKSDKGAQLQMEKEVFDEKLEQELNESIHKRPDRRSKPQKPGSPSSDPFESSLLKLESKIPDRLNVGPWSEQDGGETAKASRGSSWHDSLRLHLSLISLQPRRRRAHAITAVYLME